MLMVLQIWLFSPDHFDMLSTYVEIIRPKLSPQTDKVFVSYSGKQITGSDISKRLHACWKKAGIFDGKSIPKHLCCNIVRKSASTGIRENQPTKIQEVSDTMCHSTKTAYLHYWVSQRDLSIQSGTDALRKHFFEQVNNLY